MKMEILSKNGTAVISKVTDLSEMDGFSPEWYESELKKVFTPSELETYVSQQEAFAIQSQKIMLEEKKAEVRAIRDGLLLECDWTQVQDAPVDKEAWSVYRQELRNISLQTGFPESVNWPTKP